MRQSVDYDTDRTSLDPLWQLAAANGKRRIAASGEVLFARGDVATYVYFVVSGGVDVFRNDGKWRVVWSRTAGDVLSFDCDGQRELSCRSRGPVELIAVSRHLLARAAQQDVALAERVAMLHAEELKLMLSTLGDTGQSDGDVIKLDTRVRMVKGERQGELSARRRQLDAARVARREVNVAIH